MENADAKSEYSAGELANEEVLSFRSRDNHEINLGVSGLGEADRV